jgi:hypothetical protein
VGRLTFENRDIAVFEIGERKSIRKTSILLMVHSILSKKNHPEGWIQQHIF